MGFGQLEFSRKISGNFWGFGAPGGFFRGNSGNFGGFGAPGDFRFFSGKLRGVLLLLLFYFIVFLSILMYFAFGKE